MATIFLSYSSKDRPFVLRLAEALQAQNYDLWLDVWNIQGHHPFWDEIQQGIENASTFIFVISAHSLDKDCAALLELHHAAGLKPAPLILPVLAEKVPFETLPILLSPGYRQIHDFTGGFEGGLERLLKALNPAEAPTLPKPILPIPAEITQERRLEAAMPRQTQLARPTELRVKITLPEGVGLAGELPDYTAEGDLIDKSDVRRSTFPLVFPVDPATGKAQAIVGCLQITTSAFEVAVNPSKNSPCGDAQSDISILPDYDSRTVIFDLTPLAEARPGRARVTVTLYYLERIVAETSVATQVIEEVVSVPAWNMGRAHLAFAGMPPNVVPLAPPAPGAPPPPPAIEDIILAAPELDEYFSPEPEPIFDGLGEDEETAITKQAETPPRQPTPFPSTAPQPVQRAAPKRASIPLAAVGSIIIALCLAGYLVSTLLGEVDPQSADATQTGVTGTVVVIRPTTDPGAGDSPELTYTTKDTTLTITYPDMWQLQDREGQLNLTAEDGSTYLITPAPAAELGLDENGTVEDAMIFFLTYFTTGASDFTAQPPITLNDQPLLYLTAQVDGENKVLMVTKTPSGGFIFLAAVSQTLALEALTQQSFSLLGTASYTPPALTPTP